MLTPLKEASARAVGVKQVLRAIEEDRVKATYVARDADSFLTKRIEDACYAKNLPCYHAESMKALGQACKIDVGASAAAILK